MRIQLKRVYDGRSEDDGMRILVDGIWPRGISKHDAALDEWVKELAPSSGLRKWYGHDRSKWKEFRERYFSELDEKREEVRELAGRLRGGKATFLFAARDVEYNNAVALADYLKRFDNN